MMHVRAWMLGALTLAIACGDDETSSSGAGAAGAGGAEPEPVITILTPSAPPLPGQTGCKVTITENLPLFGQAHVPVCTKVSYQTNPPSSGEHWPIWAAFGTYAAPVPREMLVHDLEHGAVVLSFLPGASDAEILATFAQAQEDFGVDPVCANGPNPEVAARFVVTPDPLLSAPVAAAAWRATYVATCLDPPSLLGFIQAHYAEGPENFCSQGKDPADPLTGVPDCPP